MSDVVAIHCYCDQWTSETVRTTRPRLPVSDVPQFQTVIARHSLLQGSPHCIIYQVQVWTVCWHMTGWIKVNFRSAGIWWCLAVWHGTPSCCCRSTLFEFISVVPSLVVVTIITWLLHHTIWHNLILMYVKNYMIRSMHLKDTSKKVSWPRFWPRLYSVFMNSMFSWTVCIRKSQGSFPCSVFMIVRFDWLIDWLIDWLMFIGVHNKRKYTHSNVTVKQTVDIYRWILNNNINIFIVNNDNDSNTLCRLHDGWMRR